MDHRYKTLHKGDSSGDVNEVAQSNFNGIIETQTQYYKGDIKQERQSFSDFYKKAKAAKNKKQSDKTYTDTRRHGVKFSDAKGSGRIRDGKKYYD